jgi:hypothetical protein
MDMQDAFEEAEDASDEDLPELDDIMDFDTDADTDDDVELASAGDSEELELDLDQDFDADHGIEDDDLSPETDEDELDLLDAENLLDDDELSLGDDDAEHISDELELDVGLDDDAAAADDELDLGDLETDDEELDLDLDSDGDLTAPSGEDDASDELDLSDLEDLIDSDASPEAMLTAGGADEDLDLGLHFEAEAPESSDETETVDDLDLSDLDLDALDETSSADEDLDLDLDFDTDQPVEEATPSLEEATSPVEEAGDLAESVDELDLSDLEEMIDSDEMPGADTDTGDGVDELDLDFDLEDESAEPAADATAATDVAGEEVAELDLSDLGDLAESDDAPATELPVAAGADDQELDLSLDFDAEGDAPDAAGEASADAADELDFSDLSEMLEGDDEPAADISTDESAQELDLDFDLDLDTDAAVQDQASPETAAAGGDDEFLDIEKMLEESEDAAVETEPAGAADELDFDLDFEGDLEEQDPLEISETAEDDLEFNLLESDESALQEDVAELAPSDVQQAASTTDGLSDTTDDFATDEFTETRDLGGETEIIDDLSAPPVMPKPKRSVRKPLTVFAVFLFLLAGILILPQNFGLKIPFLSDIKIPYISDIKIPYIADKFSPELKDTVGNLRITPLAPSIKYEFVENENSGTLFVIQGRLKNDYDHPRSHIRITGKLFLKGNKLAKKATVFGGNMLTDEDLTSLNMKAIKQKLQNKAGYRKSNLRVRSGSFLPFMVVFDKLPENLDEYTIEVAGSSS